VTRGRAVAWVALALVVVVGVAVLVTRSRPDDSPEARARRIERELRCPVCEGLSVADSFEATSRAIRADIARRLEAGESDAEIRQAYVDRYGEDILLRPAGDGIGIVAWGLPVAVLVLGAGGLVLALRRWSREPRLTATDDDEVLVERARHGSDDG
jgi:cytochrome c-type biogenesis protein CcmH